MLSVLFVVGKFKQLHGLIGELFEELHVVIFELFLGEGVAAVAIAEFEVGCDADKKDGPAADFELWFVSDQVQDVLELFVMVHHGGMLR